MLSFDPIAVRNQVAKKYDISDMIDVKYDASAVFSNLTKAVQDLNTLSSKIDPDFVRNQELALAGDHSVVI